MAQLFFCFDFDVVVVAVILIVVSILLTDDNAQKVF